MLDAAVFLYSLDLVYKSNGMSACNDGIEPTERKGVRYRSCFIRNCSILGSRLTK